MWWFEFQHTSNRSVGPPNVPFTKKPYKDLDLEESKETSTTSKKEKEKEKERKEREKRAAGAKTSHSSLYPSLPSIQPGSGSHPPIGAHRSYQSSQGQTYQGYGAPTYPDQQVYQDLGVPYGSGQAAVDERTRLVSQ